MSRLRSFSLILLLSLLCGMSYGQGFDDLKQAKPVSLNTKLQSLLDKNDVSGLEKLLKSKPETKEEGSRIGQNDKGAPLVIPFFYDVVDRTLKGEVSLDICRLAIRSGCDVYTIYNGKTPIYRVMDYLATTPSSDSALGTEVLNLFFSRPDFDINRRYRTLPPPFSYLLSENFKYLGNHYDEDYLSIDLIFLLIDHGALLNTYDENGASLLLLANTTGNVRLQNYLVDNGVNIDKSANESGDNAVVSAIRSSDLSLLRRIVENYNIKLFSNDVRDYISEVSPEMYEYLASECSHNAQSYEELTDFRNLFSDKKTMVQEKYESLARQEVSAATSYEMISLCAMRYSDLNSIVEPKRRLIAEKECDEAEKYPELCLFREHYPQYSDLTARCHDRVSDRELSEVSSVRLVKDFENHYPERYQDVQSKKNTIYESDCNSVSQELNRVLASCNEHNLSVTSQFNLSDFATEYSGYYDPQNKAPLAKVLDGYYHAIEAANNKFAPYYTETNRFDDRYRSDLDYLDRSMKLCTDCLDFNIPSSWLREVLADRRKGRTNYYEQCKRELAIAEKFDYSSVPRPVSRSHSSDNYYFTFRGNGSDDFSFEVADYSNHETGHVHFVVHHMQGGRIAFIDGYSSLEDAVVVGYVAGYYGFKSTMEYTLRGGLLNAVIDNAQRKLDLVNARQVDDGVDAIMSWFR